MTGIKLIQAERARQVTEEGYTAEWDHGHDEGQLAWAACYYAMPCMVMRRCSESAAPCPIPPDRIYEETGWELSGAKRPDKSRIRQLTVAGALIAAEIDRLLAATNSE